ncbi:MAG TPA: FAD-dependent oxidoreductase [Verrucomicrobiae bacterium]|jgi:ferredoxin-NADP reductase
MQLKLIAKKPEAPGVVSFIFKPAKPLVWLAGQYLHYVLHHEPTDDRGSDRWFTIASAPSEHKVMLTTRLVAAKGSTFKKNLKALKVGDTLEIAGDVDGDFTVSNAKAEYVFLAGGIGITPFRAILKEAAHAGKALRVTLLYANRKGPVTYQKELAALAKKNPNLRVHYIFSPDRIAKDTIQRLAPAWKKSCFYVSGPEPMVESVGKMLLALGMRKKQIKQDWFPGYPAE